MLQGYARAHMHLGSQVFARPRCGSGKVEAVKWYKLAAEQRYAKAQSNLGAIYEQGLGTLHLGTPTKKSGV